MFGRSSAVGRAPGTKPERLLREAYPRYLVPAFDGAFLSGDSKDAQNAPVRILVVSGLGPAITDFRKPRKSALGVTNPPFRRRADGAAERAANRPRRRSVGGHQHDPRRQARSALDLVERAIASSPARSSPGSCRKVDNKRENGREPTQNWIPQGVLVRFRRGAPPGNPMDATFVLFVRIARGVESSLRASLLALFGLSRPISGKFRCVDSRPSLHPDGSESMFMGAPRQMGQYRNGRRFGPSGADWKDLGD
jgi:hypothetical protein